jgi:hypothetical protein
MSIPGRSNAKGFKPRKWRTRRLLGEKSPFLRARRGNGVTLLWNDTLQTANGGVMCGYAGRHSLDFLLIISILLPAKNTTLVLF